MRNDKDDETPSIQPKLSSDSLISFSLSTKQRLIYNNLRQGISEGVATIFYDACKVIVLSEEFNLTNHILWHLIRELDSALTTVLYNLSQNNDDSIHKPAILLVQDHIKLLHSNGDIDKHSYHEIKNKLDNIDKPSNRQKKEAILNYLEMPVKDELTAFWIKLTLHNLAHRRNLDYRLFDNEMKKNGNSIKMFYI